MKKMKIIPVSSIFKKNLLMGAIDIFESLISGIRQKAN